MSKIIKLPSSQNGQTDPAKASPEEYRKWLLALDSLHKKGKNLV